MITSVMKLPLFLNLPLWGRDENTSDFDLAGDLAKINSLF